jgi:pyrroloquinoline quinone (PQQ) biosynthesis protein C
VSTRLDERVVTQSQVETMASIPEFLAELKVIGDEFSGAVRVSPLVGRFVSGRVTRDEYVAFLQQAYHYVKATNPNLTAAAASLREYFGADRAALADRLAEHAAEELGHHLWILDDLEALGEPREKIDQIVICPPIHAYLAYFHHLANSRHAVGFFGQAYVLEGGAVSSADALLKALTERSSIPNIRNAVKFTELHGIVDVGHVEELMKILKKITDPTDQCEAVLSARVTAQLWLDMVEYLDRVSVGNTP